MHPYDKLDRPEILSRLFHPRREPKTPLPANALDLDFDMEPGVILGCRLYIHEKNSPTIFYFHGNGETVCDHDPIGREYVGIGCNFLVMTYRGYGWSTGTPTVASLFADGRQLFAAATARLQDFTGPLFLMGRSLGSACAIDLACAQGEAVKGLIIESGFADTLPLLRTLGIDSAGIREEDGFGNRAKIAYVRTPTLILHGARDQLIAPLEAEKLQANSGARNKQFFLIPGADHNTVIATAGRLYFQTIRQFLDSVTGTASWRNRRKRFKAEQDNQA